MRTTITVADFMELRTAVNKLRTQNFGLSQFPFTDDPLQPSVTRILAGHLTDLRAAPTDAYGVSPPAYADAIAADVTTIKTSQLNEVRSVAGALECGVPEIHASADKPIIFSAEMSEWARLESKVTLSVTPVFRPTRSRTLSWPGRSPGISRISSDLTDRTLCWHPLC